MVILKIKTKLFTIKNTKDLHHDLHHDEKDLHHDLHAVLAVYLNRCAYSVFPVGFDSILRDSPDYCFYHFDYGVFAFDFHHVLRQRPDHYLVFHHVA